MGNPIYTIGHSTHEWRRFLGLLQLHTISVVCDVRSQPYSQFNPQFNRENMRDSLKVEDIAYIYMGKELGGRPEDRDCYENGVVRYEQVAQSKLFWHGLARLKKGRKAHRLALVCAEKDPLNCHRMVLVSRQLAQEGIPVHHILENGKLETQEQALERLLEKLAISQGDMFRSRDDAILIAYSTQAGRIAYEGRQEKTSKFARVGDKTRQKGV